MSQSFKPLFFALVALVLLSILPRSSAQTHSPFPPLSATLTNHQVVITWPVSTRQWELIEQKPAKTGAWKPVAENLYRTNAQTISVTLPVPDQTCLYKVRPYFNRAGVAFPPLPQIPTNRPPPPAR